ncbi:hypothetical protein ES332_A09G099200v1 [Gossypium tomentosum]|uniref:Thioesterase domain-containing protein n=1 Tax=Gossypium tomentosum TaxID=34277 RepID=A0A5D2P0R5_GOSTO|nr:hypothetical protein ES332_A09G099200v1 [Gossypium tomentosum]
MEGGDSLKKSLALLHGVINAKIGHGLETRVLQGLHVTHAEKGFMRFDFLIPNAVSDVDGNWSVGALASLVDIIGFVTIYSFANRVTTTVDLNVSYYSTATIQVKSFLFTCGGVSFGEPKVALSSVLHPSTVDGGRGNDKRAFQPLIKPHLKAKPSRPGQSRSGSFPLLPFEFEIDDGGRSSGDAIRWMEVMGCGKGPVTSV